MLVKTNNNRRREFGYVSRNSQCFVDYAVLDSDGTVGIVTWLSDVTNDLAWPVVVGSEQVIVLRLYY